MQIDMDVITKKTGYKDIIVALEDYQLKQEPNAAWFCIEIIRPMVMGVVYNYVNYARMIGVGTLVSADDLAQEAYAHLVKALGKFTPPDYAKHDSDACARSWNRYANLAIKSPLRDHYAAAMNQIDVPSWAIKASKRINEAIAKLEADHFHAGGLAAGLKRRPDPMEVAKHSGIAFSKVKRFLDNGFDMLPQRRFAYLGSPADEDTTSHSEIADASPYGKNPSIKLESDEGELLSVVWQQLTTQQQEVMSARFGLDQPALTLTETAERLELSVKQVRLIEAKGILQMRGSLEALDDC